MKYSNVIAIYIKNELNQVLVQFHNKHQFWTIPVGYVESGENIVEGFKREAFEELGIIVKKYKLIKTYKNYYDYSGPEEVTSYMFEVLEYSGTIENLEPHKHSELKFVHINELKNMSPVSDAVKNLLIEYV